MRTLRSAEPINEDTYPYKREADPIETANRPNLDRMILIPITKSVKTGSHSGCASVPAHFNNI